MRHIVLALVLLASNARAECFCDHAPGAKCRPGDTVTCDYADLVAIRDELADVTAGAESATAGKNRAEVERDACKGTVRALEAQPQGWPGWTLPVVAVLGFVLGVVISR